MKLLVVESPTKAKTLNKFLGKDYEVIASMGHIRDIPSNKMNIDVKGDFEPEYEIDEAKLNVVKELRSKAKKAEAIYLASDPDREGEAIAYHVKWVMEHEPIKASGKGQATRDKKKNNKVKTEVKYKLVKGYDFKRITFHQITKAAVEEAIEHASKINRELVDAQQARRILDRLVGYSLSPVLWRKVRRGLSAGRVQSVALRLVVEREKEIEAFKPQEYWEVLVNVRSQGSEDKGQGFWVELIEVKGKPTVEGKGDNREFLINSEKIAEPIIADLKKAAYSVADVIKKEKKSAPKPPYTTSTLQQAAANSLGWTAKKTMMMAQALYEKGMITYHRTDSFNLAAEAVVAVRDLIQEKFGIEYLPAAPRSYKTNSKSAQEAHEAIRPTDVKLLPTGVDGDIDETQKKLYSLIWKRFVSCQMADAIMDATTIKVKASGEKTYGLKVSGAIIKFKGWKIVYGQSKVKVQDTGDKVQDTELETELPGVEVGEKLKYLDLSSLQKFTEPPPRYNDASLIKELERLGIGRPSTYAPTISTLIFRAYMERRERKFYPTAVGVTVTDFLAKNFKEIMDYSFTANMEDDLDKIAEGKRKWVPVIRDFWQPFNTLVRDVVQNSERVPIPVEKVGRICPECGESEKGELVIRTGRFGKFISCSRFPDCKYTEKYRQIIEGIKCEKCKEGDVVIKRSKTGRTFFGCARYPDCDWASWTDPRKEKEKKE